MMQIKIVRGKEMLTLYCFYMHELCICLSGIWLCRLVDTTHTKCKYLKFRFYYNMHLL